MTMTLVRWYRYRVPFYHFHWFPCYLFREPWKWNSSFMRIKLLSRSFILDVVFCYICKCSHKLYTQYASNSLGWYERSAVFAATRRFICPLYRIRAMSYPEYVVHYFHGYCQRSSRLSKGIAGFSVRHMSPIMIYVLFRVT